MAIYSGIVFADLPDDDTLERLWYGTTVNWINYPLNVASQEDLESLSSRRERIQSLGYGLLPIYETSAGLENPDEDAFSAGYSEATETCAKIDQAGFPSGTVVYIRLTRDKQTVESDSAYYCRFFLGWAEKIKMYGLTPGIVCNPDLASSIEHIFQSGLIMAKSADDVSQIEPIEAIEIKDPTTSGYSNAALWEFTDWNILKFLDANGDEISLKAKLASSLMADPSIATDGFILATDQLAASGNPGSNQATGFSVSSTLVASVADFNQTFAANIKLVQLGQFQIQDQVYSSLIASVDDELAAKASVVDQEINEAWNALKSSMELDGDIAGAQRALKKAIEDKGLKNELPDTWSILTDGCSPSWAENLYYQIWGNTDILPSPDIGKPSIAKYISARANEVSKCFDSTRSLAKKYLKAKGRSNLPKSLGISQGIIANCRIVPGMNTPDGHATQSVSYNDTQLRSLVAHMKQAIDAGYLILCGGLSGIAHEMAIYPNPEHYVLLFAHDGRDAFVFWDSDKTESKIESLGWGVGFGILFYRNNRLSTAYSDEDFKNVDSGGIHIAEPRRHRYQIYYVQTLPIG